MAAKKATRKDFAAAKEVMLERASENNRWRSVDRTRAGAQREDKRKSTLTEFPFEREYEKNVRKRSPFYGVPDGSGNIRVPGDLMPGVEVKAKRKAKKK